MSRHQAIRSECLVGEALVAAIPELRCFLGKRIELIALDLQATLEDCISSDEIAQANPSRPGTGTGEMPSHSEAYQTLIAEKQELWRRLRTLRDAMRLTDWMLLQSDYPEMRNWFDD